MESEGHQIDPEAVAVLNPSITLRLVRFGLSHMDYSRQPKPLTDEVSTLDPEVAKEPVKEAVPVG